MDNVDLKAVEEKQSAAQRKLVYIMIICLSYMVVEVILGLMIKSLAVLTDAADLLSDSAGFVINITALHYAKKKATDKLTFGYLKVEALGAFVSVLLIWVIYAILIMEAVGGLIEGGEEIDINIMFYLSCGALCLNLLKLYIAGGHSHGGGGHDDHGKGGHGDHGDKKTKGGHEHGKGGHGDHGGHSDEKEKGDHEHGKDGHGDHDGHSD